MKRSLRAIRPLSTLLALACLPGSHLLGQLRIEQSSTIRELVVQALENNQELEVARFAPRIQQTAIRQAWGSFDPVFSWELSHDESERNLDQRTFNSVFSNTNSTTSRIYKERNSLFETGLSGGFSTGTAYDIQFNIEEINNDTNNFLTEYSSEVSATLTQSLLRGFGRDANLTRVRLAKSNLERENYRLQNVVMGTIRDTMQASVELLFAQRNLEVKRQSVSLARELKRENEKRFEQGRMSEIDVLQADARISEAIEEELRAQNFHIERTNALRLLIYKDPMPHLNDPIKIVGQLNSDYTLPTLADVFRTTLERNPEYLGALQLIESQDYALVEADQGLLPTLDLEAGLSYHGLEFNDHFGAISDYTERDKPSWNVGLRFSYPLWNREAKGRKRQALLQKRQAKANVVAAKNQLATTLDSAIKIVSIAKQRIATSEQSVRLGTATLEAEKKRLDNGLTTSYNVAEAQKNLSVAQTRQLAATVEYEKSLINLWALMGIIGDRMDIEIEKEKVSQDYHIPKADEVHEDED